MPLLGCLGMGENGNFLQLSLYDRSNLGLMSYELNILEISGRKQKFGSQ